MATINRPAFPDPALEVGIAQYPTPNVPDYFTREGHIILVEKVSIEKGSYNPQPLDGSVIYSGRDANDWPSNLYLVFQQTEPTGKFVFNYWANDRTLASQDPWNYGLSYSLNHPDYKIITRTYITPREDYTPVALGSVDPVFGGNAIISQQQMAELPEDNPLRSRYVQVQRVYETIPSPTLTGRQYDEFFQSVLTITEQVVTANSTAPAITDGLLSYRDEIIDSVKTKRTIVTTPSLPPTRTEYKTGTYTSPLLVFDIDFEQANMACPPLLDIRIKLTPITRGSQSGPTTFKTVTSYSYGPPAAGDTGIFSPKLREVSFTGFVINFNLGAALCDHITSGAGVPVQECGEPFDPVYETWDIPATTPTASEYLGIVNSGVYQKISWESRYWKAGIWESKTIYVRLI